MRSFLICALLASMASAFHTLILPKGSDGVFPSQVGETRMGVSQQSYPSAVHSGSAGGTDTSLAMSGRGPAISSGIIPSQNSLNGTYNNPIRLPQTSPSTNLQDPPPAKQPKPTSKGSYVSVIQDPKLTTATPTLSSSQQPKPTSTMSYTPIAPLPTPSPIQLAPVVAPERNSSNPQNIVPQVQIGLDYAETGNNGMHL